MTYALILCMSKHRYLQAGSLRCLNTVVSLIEPMQAYSSGFSHRSQTSAPAIFTTNNNNNNNRSSFNLQGSPSRVSRNDPTQNHKVKQKPTARVSGVSSETDVLKMSLSLLISSLPILFKFLYSTCKLQLQSGSFGSTHFTPSCFLDLHKITFYCTT